MTGRLPGRVRSVVPWRSLVLLVALASTALKIYLAATTFGTNDVHSWTSFAQGIRDVGLIEVYGREYYTQYNHPPLSGLMLLGINALTDAGVGDLPLLVRIPASAAVLVTALQVFELVRAHRPVGAAAVAGVLVALSPVLMVISGFHGNTDPLFVMFVLLAVHCVHRGRGFAGGLSFALALSVKIVPVVLVPLLLVALVQAGWRRLGAFVVGGLVVFVPLWGPVLLFAWPEFSINVLGYNGVQLREWGLPQFLTWSGASPAWLDLLTGRGRFVVLAVSALVPAALLWRRPGALGPATGLALALFLLLSPAFSMQYLVWPLAAAYLVGPWTATAYNVAASVFVLSVYDNWNAGRDGVPRPPWEWYEGVAVAARPVDMTFMVVAWVALAAVVVAGFVRLIRAGSDPDPAPTDPDATTVVEPWPSARYRAQA